MTRYWTAIAPVRVADLGGWTDTWFAGHGLVCSVAIRPGVEVRLRVDETAGPSGRVVIEAENVTSSHHPLLEAAIAEVGVPDGIDLTVTVHSDMPPGASTGTSAAVTVALVAALSALGGAALTRDQVAVAAHHVESVGLGRQTGIQDQLAAVHGGINRIRMRSYPDATTEPVDVSSATAWELESRLLVVFLGKVHDSSAVHAHVIGALEAAGPAEVASRLDPLRAAAEAGAASLEQGDLRRYGRALVANTEAQAALHPDLVSEDAHRIIAAVREVGAAGWKVNGAGGAGGSLTILAGPAAGARRRLAEVVRGLDPAYVPMATSLDTDGLRVWSSTEVDGP